MHLDIMTALREKGFNEGVESLGFCFNHSVRFSRITELPLLKLVPL
jgi:hypothetical protein